MDFRPGKTVLVVGGGPSLKDFDLSPGRALPTIAVNNAYQIAPWAQIVFCGDARWLVWHGDKLGPLYSRVMTTAMDAPPTVARVELTKGPTERANTVWGGDSGHRAVILAAKMGATRIILAGFDMRWEGGEAHWHPDHPIPSSEANYELRMKPQYPALKAWLGERGVDLLSCTPTALDLPVRPLQELISA